jgi:hypothetical protein
MKQTGATICRLLSAFAVAVLLLISMRALCLSVRAESVPDGKNYIKVVVHDTNKATAFNNISSSFCNKHKDVYELVYIPTKRNI